MPFEFNAPRKKPSRIVSAMGEALRPTEVPIASIAAGLSMTDEQLDAAQREAALRMPIKDAIKDLGAKLAAEVDVAVVDVLRKHLNLPGATPDELMAAIDRREFTLSPGHAFDAAGTFLPPEERGEVYALDNVPLLWVGPVKLEREDMEMKASRTLRHLV